MSDEEASPDDLMKEEIWRNFPEDLYELVLAKLPFVALFRFRLVCKNWNSLLTDEMKSDTPLFYTLYCIGDSRMFMSIYDPCSNRWYHPILPCLVPSMLDHLFHVGSAQGLVCREADGYFYVCNTIYQSFKVLPRRLEVAIGCHGHMAMVPDKTVGAEDGYIIIWYCDASLSFYKSRDNSWTPATSIPSFLLIKEKSLLNYGSHVVYMDGTLHFMTKDKPEVITSCDVATGIWKQTRVPLPMMNMARHEMTGYQGKLILIGLLAMKEEEDASTSQVWIWELETPLWKEIDKMPETIDIDLRKDTYGLTKYWLTNYYIGNKGDVIMWTFNPGRTNQRHVMYNFKTRKWRLDVPNLVVQRNTPMSLGFAFQPILCLFENLTSLSQGSDTTEHVEWE